MNHENESLTVLNALRDLHQHPEREGAREITRRGDVRAER